MDLKILPDELLPCPFCGTAAQLLEREEERWLYRTGKQAKGMRLLRTMERGRRTIYVFAVSKFMATCLVSGCRGHDYGHAYVSKETAIETWNQRAGSPEIIKESME